MLAAWRRSLPRRRSRASKTQSLDTMPAGPGRHVVVALCDNNSGHRPVPATGWRCAAIQPALGRDVRRSEFSDINRAEVGATRLRRHRALFEITRTEATQVLLVAEAWRGGTSPMRSGTFLELNLASTWSAWRGVALCRRAHVVVFVSGQQSMDSRRLRCRISRCQQGHASEVLASMSDHRLRARVLAAWL